MAVYQRVAFFPIVGWHVCLQKAWNRWSPVPRIGPEKMSFRDVKFSHLLQRFRKAHPTKTGIMVHWYIILYFYILHVIYSIYILYCFDLCFLLCVRISLKKQAWKKWHPNGRPVDFCFMVLRVIFPGNFCRNRWIQAMCSGNMRLCLRIGYINHGISHFAREIVVDFEVTYF